MKNMFWKIIGASIITSIVVNGIVNTTSRIRRDRLEDENYQEELKKKKQDKEIKKIELELKKAEAEAKKLAAAEAKKRAA